MSLKPLVAEIVQRGMSKERLEEVSAYCAGKNWRDFETSFGKANLSAGGQSTKERIRTIADALSEVLESTTLTDMYGWA